MTKSEFVEIIARLQKFQAECYDERTIFISVSFGYVSFTYFYTKDGEEHNGCITFHEEMSYEQAMKCVEECVAVLEETEPDKEC